MAWTIHCTVPFPMIEEGAAPVLGAAGVGAEIYLSGAVLDAMNPERAGRAAESLRAARVPTTTFHAPFEDLWPGARDEEARRLAARRLRQAISLAPVFRPLGIVAHGGYSEWIFDFSPSRWLEPARRTFAEAAEAADQAGVDLLIENVFDDVPDHLLRLREAVGSRRLAFCLDPGHAALFSRLPVRRWVEAMGPALREIHVHDNRGLRDDHLPIGDGSIDFRGVLLAVRDAGAGPILTVEPHREDHFHRSVGSLRAVLDDLG